MKKIFSFAIIILLTITVYCSCTQEGLNSISVQDTQASPNYSHNFSGSTDMNFQYFFRGFIPLKENQVATYPTGTYIINTDRAPRI
jgi:hypothetical protein